MPTKILVADDSVTMRRVLEMTFAGEDATVHAVDSAEAVLAKAVELAPDVLFADASMPGMDGYELARRVKTAPQLSRIAVIVMASQQAPYDEAKGRAAGVDDHISKPFDTQSVIDRVAQVLARTRALPAIAEAGGRPPAPPARPAPPANATGPGPNTGTGRMAPGPARMGLATPAQPAAHKVAASAPQPVPALRPGSPPLAPVPGAKPSLAPPAPAARAAAATMPVVSQDLGTKLAHLGLTREQIEGVLALSREVIEQVVWEVVPDLAEQLIKDEIKRLTSE